MLSETATLRLITQSISIFDKSIKSARAKQEANPAKNFESNLRSHLAEVANWSSQISFHPMTTSINASDDTIPLKLSNIPRRYRKADQQIDYFEEHELLSDHSCMLVIGDPGAGKTTTIKRINHKLLFESKEKSQIEWSYPITLILRRQDTSRNIYRIIADILGIKYTVSKNKSEQEKQTVKLTKNELAAKREIDEELVYERQMAKRREDSLCMVGEQRLENFVCNLLDDTNCLLLVDGLDEINSAEQISLIKELSEIGQKLSRSKVIATVRSGLGLHIEGFKIFEICPLSDDDINEICSHWCQNADELLIQLENLGYRELCTRPLFLCYLIVIFENQKELPKKPSQVYRRVLRMFLEDWNLHPQVERATRYAKFDSDTKIEFLSALAFELLFKLDNKIFSESDLDVVYRSICEQFELPSNEAKTVAQELETHTGIIAQVDLDSYEFTHLSIMEYLAGQHLSLGYDVADINRFMKLNPSATAVGLAASSRPSDLLGRILLLKHGFRSVAPGTWLTFLRRVKLENPNFESSKLLGEGLLKILCLKSDDINEIVFEILRNQNVAKSLTTALASFKYLRQPNENIVQFLREIHTEKYGRILDFPDKFSLEIGTVDKISQSIGIKELIEENEQYQRIQTTVH